MIENPTQIRMARALVGWTLKDLAERVKINANSISRIERQEVTNPQPDTLAKIERVFEDTGVEFLAAYGVRKKSSVVKHSEGVEIIHKGGEPLKKITENIHKANGDIIVYGRAPAGFDDIQKEYMTSIVSFLKEKLFSYTRILLISDKFPEASYLWLIFMRKLFSDGSIRQKTSLKVIKVNSPPDIYTPMQAIGDNFVHYGLGELSVNPERHINSMLSFFISGKDDCEYFIDFLKYTVLNLPGSVTVNSRKVLSTYIDEYRTEIKDTDEEEGRKFVEKADKFVDEICEPFFL